MSIDLPTEPPTYRSVSQVGDLERCPYMYYLKRIKEVYQRPAAWTAQGSAVHEAVEAWEKSGRTMSLEEVTESFNDSYARFTDMLLAETPNLKWWFPSGPYTADLDIPRRWQKGLDQVAAYLEYYTVTAPREVLWVAPDGTLGCELDVETVLDGIPVRGYVDEVIDHPKRGTIVRDVKTGNLPGGPFQLAVYAVLVNQLFGLNIADGDYWMGRLGKPTHPYDLSEWPREAVSREFARVDTEIKAGNFPPKPEEDKCRFCSVRDSCEFAI